jgi:guanidinobutyrase
MAFNQPLSGNDMPRFGGITTMFRLPEAKVLDGVDVAIVGVPLDIGTSNRNGARFGPREIRSESVLVRPYGMATRAAPFESFQVADYGDIAFNPYSLSIAVTEIEAAFRELLKWSVIPISLGGDHTISLPILRALASKHGRLGLIHVDAHADMNDTMYGERITHGTIFRRAIEEELVDPKRMVQIGLRATGYAADDFDWARNRGVRVVRAEDCWYKSLTPLMAEVREQVGGGPVYLTFDIDGLDPSVAPGTGTPEPGGLTGAQALEIIRGASGLPLVGCDLVEVSPPYDNTGNTALLASNLVFEMLCALPDCIRR